MNDVRKAYLAGFFDSDGCICISHWRRKSGSMGHQLLVNFVQRDKEFLQSLCDEFSKGFVSVQSQSLGVYQWVLSARSGVAILQALVPFLYIKRKEAELALEFKAETAWDGQGRLPAELVQKREKYREALSALKRPRQPTLPCSIPSGPLTKVECAYLAGFIDGDGCIAITSHDKKSCSTPVYDLWLVIAQRECDAFLRYWQQRTGLGTVFSKKGQWRLASKAAEELLCQVMPFLRLKKEQAEVALQFRATFNGRQGGLGRRYGGHESHTLPHVIAERERCRQAIAGMNGHKQGGYDGK